MNLPTVTNNYFTEREGVIAVEKIINQMKCVWRETNNKDIGIDGQIEYVDNLGNATGHVIAVQIKAGESFMKKHDDFIKFYPNKKHVTYWEMFPIPVVVIIVDPISDKYYWADVRNSIRSGLYKKYNHIRIPLKNELNKTDKSTFFQELGAFETELLSYDKLLKYMACTTEGRNIGNPSYLDMFLNGLTDVCRKLFFSTKLYINLLEYTQEEDIGINVDYEFIDNYITFLVSQNIIFYDYSDYIIDFKLRHMLPIFICPLTSRGSQFLNYIDQYEEKIISENSESYRKLSKLFYEEPIDIEMSTSKIIQIQTFAKHLLNNKNTQPKN